MSAEKRKGDGVTVREFFFLLFHFKLRKLFVAPTTNTFVQFFRFAFVGTAATAFDYGVTAVVRELFGFSDELSTACGFAVGLVVNYVLSVLWVFNSKNINRAKEFTVFAVIGVIGLGLNTLLIYLFGELFDLNMPVYIPKIGDLPLFYIFRVLATLITFVWNFTARKYILYNKK